MVHGYTDSGQDRVFQSVYPCHPQVSSEVGVRPQFLADPKGSKTLGVSDIKFGQTNDEGRGRVLETLALRKLVGCSQYVILRPEAEESRFFKGNTRFFGRRPQNDMISSGDLSRSFTPLICVDPKPSGPRRVTCCTTG
jgi:hypothetical protein